MQVQRTLTLSRLLTPRLLLSQIPCAWWWLVAQVFSLWPTWVWMGKRMSDSSDDPLGILALAVLGLSLWQLRRQLETTPRLPWLLLGLSLTLLATLSLGRLPSLLTGVISMLALTASLLAFLPKHIARLPVLGLFILALPLLSSLQFYAGYPLRVVTAEVSSWLLAIAYDVQREGSTLLVNNKLIIVDAPCSGVQMAWLGYFTACTLALRYRLSNRQFFLRLPFVGLLVLTGNIVRNSVLVALQARQNHPPEWLHQGIGLVALALVCLAIACLILRASFYRDVPNKSASGMKNKASRVQKIKHPHKVDEFLNTAKQSISPAQQLIRRGMFLFLWCFIWSAYQATAVQTKAATSTPFVEWPYEWRGVAIRPLALSEVEERFAQNFPGAITRMTDDKHVFVFRQVDEPTRKLHPAVDCYKGLGYRIAQEQLHTDTKGLLWRCFVATRNAQSLQVCEHIEDMCGQSYTDTSAWYWSAMTQPGAGPWTTITIAKAIDGNGANARAVIE